jgi:transcriptional regulator with XRE-family HTH domain
MTFGARLREERKRLGLKQAEFAALVGTDVPKQSLYENGHRSLRAAYLARTAAAGVDVLYVLTGRRSEGEWLDSSAGEFLSAYLKLPSGFRGAVAHLVDDLRRLTEHPGGGE